MKVLIDLELLKMAFRDAVGHTPEELWEFMEVLRTSGAIQHVKRYEVAEAVDEGDTY